MSGHEKWFELADIYAAGALDGNELREFESHFSSGCNLCSNYLREAEDTLALLPKSLSLQPAPAFVKQRVLDQISQEAIVQAGAREAAPVFSFNWAAGLVMFGLVAALGTTLYQTRQRMMDYKKVNDQLAEPDTRLVAMKPTEPGPAADAKMLWNPKSCSGVFMARSLAPLPEGKVYELWAISGSETIPAGTFTVDGKGCVKMNLSPIPHNKTIEKFAVTLEPVGGVLKPTGAMVLAGTV